MLSFNLRVNVTQDGIHAWTNRKSHVLDFIQSNDFDIIGFQEVTPNMYQELYKALNLYDGFGVGRDVNQEAIPIFIKKNQFTILESKTLWLSNTPTVESKIDGSYFPRIVTYVVVEDQNHTRISFFNTHLDYASDNVCKKQATILSKVMDRITAKYQSFVVLCGDFNQYPQSKTIQYLTNRYQSVFDRKTNIGLTFHGFTNETNGLPIDYFFYSKPLRLEAFKIINHLRHDIYLSDHYPISAMFSFEK